MLGLVRRLSEAMKKSRSARFLCRTFGASGLAVLVPGLTAGPTYSRLFEAGLEAIVNLVLRSSEQTNQARSAGST
jgi:hypothetical protein